MRKEIIPVCSTQEARYYLARKGLTYDDITEGDILVLIMLLNKLNKHIKKAKRE